MSSILDRISPWPWKENFGDVQDRNKRTIGRAETPDIFEDDKRRIPFLSNAIVMAAAPELLSAAKEGVEALRALGTSDPDDTTTIDAIQHLDDVISRTEGGIE